MWQGYFRGIVILIRNSLKIGLVIFQIKIYFELTSHALHGQSSKEFFGFGLKIKNSKAWSQPLRAMRKFYYKWNKGERAPLQRELFSFSFKRKYSKIWIIQPVGLMCKCCHKLSKEIKALYCKQNYLVLVSK